MLRVAFALAMTALTGHASAADTSVNIAGYDASLCQTAQRLIVNAGDELNVIEQHGVGAGFHTIQMSVDTGKRAVVIAATTDYAQLDGVKQPTYVSCKMVNRARVNDSLKLQLPEPERQCRAVNESTYALTLSQLSPGARERYDRSGRKLMFADDAIVATGGEWLPITLDAFITGDADGNVTATSPSVRVPWNPVEKNFFQGTQHCKLISMAAMHRWVTKAAFSANTPLVPLTDTTCTAPASMTSTVGSCRFYFAPANAMFCQDYSGSEWTSNTAQKECAGRHASPGALKAAKNRYEGAGGVFSDDACATRTDTETIAGTCVFHCKAGDETLWHITGAVDPRMTKGCDLFIGGDIR